MGDHSLLGYLRRRSTEELEGILYYCLREDNYKNYEHAIPAILRVLNERFTPDWTSEKAQRVREMLLRYERKE